MTFPVAAGDPEDFTFLIGMTLEEAAQSRCGLTIRVTMRDDRPLIVTQDYRLDRLNVAVKDGLIVSVGKRG